MCTFILLLLHFVSFLFCFSFRYTVYVVRKKQVKPEHKTTNKNMGNQGSSRGGGGPSGHGPPAADEPLEAYLREKQRNDHLKNLGLKRHTSLRKSISKKLKRHKKQPSTATNTNPPINEQNHTTNNTTSTTTGSIEVVDNGGTNSKKQKSHCDVHEEQPFRRPSNSGQDDSQSNIPSKVKPSGSLDRIMFRSVLSLNCKKNNFSSK